uniref:Uncharacterized protein n=1 Tax=viral metagenome TaxID=1070528 RepID=A0A6M3XAZ8_9ZZZZ
MPTPQPNEDRNSFVSRCIRQLRREGKHNQKEIVGKCEGMYTYYTKRG